MARIVQNRVHVEGPVEDLKVFYDRLEGKNGSHKFSTDRLLGENADVIRINTNVPVMRDENQIVFGFASLGGPPLRLYEVISRRFSRLTFRIECYPSDGFNFKLWANEGKVHYA